MGDEVDGLGDLTKRISRHDRVTCFPDDITRFSDVSRYVAGLFFAIY